MDMCQHVPKFITDKTCLGAPGDENIGKMWNIICEIGTRTDIVRWVDLYNYFFFGGGVYSQGVGVNGKYIVRVGV